MKPLFIAISFHLSFSSSPSRDPWFSPDKAEHFFMGALIQTTGYSGMRLLGAHNGFALGMASLGTVVGGAGKEWYDRGHHGDPSFKDFTWTLLGGAAITPALVHTAR